MVRPPFPPSVAAPARCGRRPSARAAAAITLLAAFAAAPALGAGAERPTVIEFHADWCGTCALVEPVLETLEREHRGLVRFVRFDVSNRASLASSRHEAERLGLLEVFEAFRSRTGTVAVLDPRGEPVEVFRGETDLDRYRAAIARAAARATPQEEERS